MSHFTIRFEDCRRELIEHGGQALYANWAASPEVKAFTEGFVHQRLYQIGLDRLEAVRQQVERNPATTAPLGDVAAGEAIQEVEDHFPNYPLTHLFHSYIEETGRVPTFVEFWDFLQSPQQHDKCYGDFLQLLRQLNGYSQRAKERALRWRIGNAYSSGFREVYTLAWLREHHGLNLRYHLFADIQLQTDFWLGQNIIALRVPNQKLGRKRDPAAWAHRFHIITLDIGQQGYGKLWLPTPAQLERLAGLMGQPLVGAGTTITAGGETSRRWRRPNPAPVPLQVPPQATTDQGASGTGAGDSAAISAAPQEVAAAAMRELGLSHWPRHSVLLVREQAAGGATLAGALGTLLKNGIKVWFIAPEPPPPDLQPFQEARLFVPIRWPQPPAAALPAEATGPQPAAGRRTGRRGRGTPASGNLTVLDGQMDDQARQRLEQLGAECREFNWEQYQVEHAPPEQHLAIMAGAGTGKTATMVDRVIFLLHIDPNLSPREIGMITFTRAATREMRDRLASAFRVRFQLTGQPRYLQWLEDLSFMQISTIPAFARKLLQAVGAALGYGRNFRIREFQQERRQIIEAVLNDQLLPRLAGREVRSVLRDPLYRFVDTAIGYWKAMENKGLSPAEIAGLDWGPPPDDAASRELHQIWPQLFAQASRRLEELKIRENAISLSDLTRQLDQIRGQVPGSLKAAFPLRFLFIDEFQDTDDTQIRLVAWMQQELESRLFVVGDVKQSIYRFRGATYTAFEVLAELLRQQGRGLTTYTLVRNYRTAANVLAGLDRYFTAWGNEDWLPYGPGDRLLGVVAEPGELEIIPTQLREHEGALGAQVVERIRRAQQDLPEKEQVALLVRTNDQAARIKDLCERQPDPIFCQVEQGGTLFSSRAVRDLATLVAALLYPNDPTAMLNLYASPYAAVRVPWPLLLEHKGNPRALREFLATRPPHPVWPELVERRRLEPVLALLRRALNEMQPVQRYYDEELAVLRQQYPGAAPDRLAAEAGARAAQYHRNLTRVLELLHQAFSEDFLTLFGLHRWLEVQKATNRNEDEPALAPAEQMGRVICTTVHKAKGAQYHTVIVPFTQRRFRIQASELLLERDGGNWRAGWRLQTYRGPQYRSPLHAALEPSEVDEVKKEETRLLYVALTRVRRRLWVLRYVGRRDNWGRLLRAGE